MLITNRQFKKTPSSFLSSRDQLRRGFSLVELLMVMAVIGLLLALTAPTMLQMGPSRKAAAMELVGFLERARAKAVSAEDEVFVAFANEDHPVESLRFRSYAFFVREFETDPDLPMATLPLRQISEWLELPQGMVFGNASHFSVEADYPIRTLHDLPNRREFSVKSESGIEEAASFPYLVFAPSGQVIIPTFANADGLNLAVLEGIVSADGKNVEAFGAETSQGGSNGELLQISYYTGRASILTD